MASVNHPCYKMLSWWLPILNVKNIFSSTLFKEFFSLSLSQTFKFSSIRVDNPVVLVVNKKKLNSNRLAPSTLLVTTKSEWIIRRLPFERKYLQSCLLCIKATTKLETNWWKWLIQGEVHLQEMNLLSKETPSAEFYGNSLIQEWSTCEFSFQYQYIVKKSGDENIEVLVWKCVLERQGC